jgi:hypothetical protein
MTVNADGKSVAIVRWVPTTVAKEVMKTEMRTVSESVNVNGRTEVRTKAVPVQVKVTETATVMQPNEYTVSVDGLTLLTVGGEAARLPAAGSSAGVVLVPPGVTVDPTYLALFRPETLVVTEAAQAPAPVQAPAVQPQPVAAPAAPAGAPAAPPIAPQPPVFAPVMYGQARTADGKLHMRRMEFQNVWEQVEKKFRDPNGVEKPQMVTVCKTVCIPVNVAWDLARPGKADDTSMVRLQTPGGGAVNPESLAKETAVVAYHSRSGALDPVLVKLLRPDAVVVRVDVPHAVPAAPSVVPTPGPAIARPVPMPPAATAVTPSIVDPPASPMQPAPDMATANHQLLVGRELLARRRYVEAAEAFRLAADASQGEPMPLYFLAFTQYSAGQWDAAEQTVRQAVAAERGHLIEPLGRDWERFQGPSRAWLSTARARSQGH